MTAFKNSIPPPDQRQDYAKEAYESKERGEKEKQRWEVEKEILKLTTDKNMKEALAAIYQGDIAPQCEKMWDMNDWFNKKNTLSYEHFLAQPLVQKVFDLYRKTDDNGRIRIMAWVNEALTDLMGICTPAELSFFYRAGKGQNPPGFISMGLPISENDIRFGLQDNKNIKFYRELVAGYSKPKIDRLISDPKTIEEIKKLFKQALDDLHSGRKESLSLFFDEPMIQTLFVLYRKASPEDKNRLDQWLRNNFKPNKEEDFERLFGKDYSNATGRMVEFKASEEMISALNASSKLFWRIFSIFSPGSGPEALL